MENVKKMTDLMSKADAACVFARSKTMGRLMKNIEHPNGTFIGTALVVGLAATGFVSGGVAASLGWSPGDVAGALSATSIFGIPLFAMSVKMLLLNRWEKQANAAGVCIMKNADQPPTAVTKLRIIDAYESLNISAEQHAMLKSLAQRGDIPAGWWETVSELIEQCREDNLERIRQQKENEEVHNAEQRLAALSTVSVASIHTQNMDACAKTRQTDPPRLMV